MRTVRVLGACLVGSEAELVTVEARFDRREAGKTEVILTGLPDAVIRESRGRLVCALEANRMHLPHGRLFLNLVPAALPKVGGGLDLAMVLAAAIAAGHVGAKAHVGAQAHAGSNAVERTLFLGEVGIDGTLHAVPGGLAVALAAKKHGVETFVAPRETASEAAWIPGVHALVAERLEDVIAHVSGVDAALSVATGDGELAETDALDPAGIDDVRGQALGKLALAVAAAGGHGLLFVGPPGAGKSMLARRLGSLCPELTIDERLEITRVLSAAGRWPRGLARARPFRAPHHTVSYAGLVGGGSPPSPGEITLAHCGVLFLDELPEFRREVLEALRQPLETGTILLSRAGRQVELPAQFQLVAAMNPCPCGFQGHPKVACRCPPSHVQRYRSRISGPLLDRIDLRVELAAPTLDELSPHGARPAPRRDAHSVSDGDGPVDSERTLARERTARALDVGARAAHAVVDRTTAAAIGSAARPARPLGSITATALEPHGRELATRVARARERMRSRQGPLRNAELQADALDQLAPLAAESRRLLARANGQRALSARAVQALRRVARTLADLDDEPDLDAGHIARALALRSPLV